MPHPSLAPAAGVWQDATPDNLPPVMVRALCHNVSQNRVFVAQRVDNPDGRWLWQWGTKEYLPADSVDRWATITLRD